MRKQACILSHLDFGVRNRSETLRRAGGQVYVDSGMVTCRDSGGLWKGIWIASEQYQAHVVDEVEGMGNSRLMNDEHVKPHQRLPLRPWHAIGSKCYKLPLISAETIRTTLQYTHNGIGHVASAPLRFLTLASELVIK